MEHVCVVNGSVHIGCSNIKRIACTFVCSRLVWIAKNTLSSPLNSRFFQLIPYNDKCTFQNQLFCNVETENVFFESASLILFSWGGTPTLYNHTSGQKARIKLRVFLGVLLPQKSRFII